MNPGRFTTLISGFRETLSKERTLVGELMTAPADRLFDTHSAV